AAPDGRWDASLIQANGSVIPFRLDISGSGSGLKGVFYNGFQPYEQTTSAWFKDGKLVLKVDHYLTTLTASLANGQLEGKVISQSRDSSAEYGFRATRHVDSTNVTANVPRIAGSWEIPLKTPSSKGEKAFRLIVEQKGADAAASILRVDGDTGAYSGTFKDGKWVLSHFDGSRPGVIVISARGDGTLEVLQNPERTTASAPAYGGSSAEAKAYDNSLADGRYASRLVAYRAELARAKGLPEPEDYETHTTARD